MDLNLTFSSIRVSSFHPRPRLFTNSIASIRHWAEGPVPEEVQYDAGVAVGFCHGDSKYIVEWILDRSRLPASSFRIGQVAGGPREELGRRQWLPMIIKSSVSLGALPDVQGLTAWLSPYAISGAILDVAFAEEQPPSRSILCIRDRYPGGRR
ncbi:hypothetical protein M405DRAFT_863524 [Rhizopogon salebrosus TDB-379]|nr:hypothetical protein M405DRAFT_863524 [Rhizopogon salebrosus TDB-379]